LAVGVLAISETLRAELLASDVSVGVSVLCPGGVRTNIMTSERNWPAGLGKEPEVASDALSGGMRQVVTDAVGVNGVSPTVAADAVVAAIKSNRFVVTTDTDHLRTAAEDRLAMAKEAQGPSVIATEPS
jgi:short-subunit dehydrogenase